MKKSTPDKALEWQGHGSIQLHRCALDCVCNWLLTVEFTYPSYLLAAPADFLSCLLSIKTKEKAAIKALYNAFFGESKED